MSNAGHPHAGQQPHQQPHQQPAPGWGTNPAAAVQQQPEALVRTGPSGMVLGTTARGPVSIRLFRPKPTRLVVAGPQYVNWLLTYRTVSMGAHISVLPEHPRDWQGLIERIRRSNGTADLLGPGAPIPEAGRSYRPSLIVSDIGPAAVSPRPGGRSNETRELNLREAPGRLGSWQAMLMPSDLTGPASVQTLRNCDLALIAPQDERVLENMRKAYFLNARQVKAASMVASDELLLAMPRRIVKLAIRPTRTEYQILFG